MSPHTLAAVSVHVDQSPEAGARISVARSVAEQHGAVLRGVAAGTITVPTYAPFSEGMLNMQPTLVEAIQKDCERRLTQAQTLFRERSSPDSEWTSGVMLEPASLVIAAARSSDVLVVGRNGTKDIVDPIMGVSASDIILRAGRPVLVVPPDVSTLSAQQVVVGWKDTRETRRAIQDALPFLQRAKEVFLVTVGREDREAEIQQVATHLTRHGVTVKVVQERGGPGGVADSLVEVARRVNADLIVSGGYGQSRMREWILGGVTRDLLAASPICCLFSH